MSYYIPKTLLGTSSTKTLKGENKGYTTYIMYLAPHTMNEKGINLCPFASKGCTFDCLYISGRGKFNSVQKARINKANYYVGNRSKFIEHLFNDVERIRNRHKKRGDDKFCIRLNGTSDINWLRQRIDGVNIFEEFNDVQFYDYTKNHYMLFENSEPNYDLTFSRHEDNHEIAMSLLADKVSNVAIVFANDLPDMYNGFNVINGDIDDLRFLDDGPGNLVGLKYKIASSKHPTDFVIQ